MSAERFLEEKDWPHGFVVEIRHRPMPSDKWWLKAAMAIGIRSVEIVSPEGIPYEEAERIRDVALEGLERSEGDYEVRIAKYRPPELNLG